MRGACVLTRASSTEVVLKLEEGVLEEGGLEEGVRKKGVREESVRETGGANEQVAQR